MIIQSCCFCQIAVKASEGISLAQHVGFQEECQEFCTLAPLFPFGRKLCWIPLLWFSMFFKAALCSDIIFTFLKKTKQEMISIFREFGLQIRRMLWPRKESSYQTQSHQFQDEINYQRTNWSGVKVFFPLVVLGISKP